MALLENIRAKLYGANDIIYLDAQMNESGIAGTLCFIDGMINGQAADENILRPLSQNAYFNGCKTPRDAFDLIMRGAVHHVNRKEAAEGDEKEIIAAILTGSVALFFPDFPKCALFETKGFERRGVSEPAEENVLKGPKDSFVESLRANTSLIRQRIQSADLRIRDFSVGEQTPTAVNVIYLDKIANPELIEKICERVARLKIDRVTSTGAIEEGIVDHKYSLFPQMLYTERPDKLCAHLQEGKAAVLINGFPPAFIAPSVFNMLFQSPEDYSENYIRGSLTRLLRYLCAFASLVLPAFYISVSVYHPEMLPVDMAAAIIRSKQGVPFPPALEVIFMLVAFEVLIESGLRLPKAIGQTISIVGGLVVGDAAASAKFVSPIVVVIIAITAICGFVTPNQDLSNAFRLLRLCFVIFAAAAGLFGMSVGIVLLIYYLCTRSSFGYPFMEAYATKNGKMRLRDGLFRFPTADSRKKKGETP